MNRCSCRRLLPLHYFVFVLALPVSFAAAPAAYQLRIDAGPLDRNSTLIRFDLPDLKNTYHLFDINGGELLLQPDFLGHAYFWLNHLDQNSSAVFHLRNSGATPAAPAPSVQFVQQGQLLKGFIAAQPVFSYQLGPGQLPRPEILPIYQRGGYIHSILTPAGKLISDDYPPNHIHHHGIWFAWTKTEFQGRHPDFWNMGQGSGTVEFTSLDQFWSGPVHGGFIAKHRYVDLSGPSPAVALYETWVVRLYAPPATQKTFWMFDLENTQECASTNALALPQYYYGGLGFRGNRDWNGAGKTFFLTSQGITNRVQGNATAARWCHISGMVGGAQAGIAILGHPDNFRAPQPMRLHPNEPFFCYAPSNAGAWEIRPGVPYLSRYRFIVQDGPPNAADLDRQWADYALPPTVILSREP